MSRMHPVQVIAVTGGKGGVGKTNIAVNLSVALAERGRQVMLLDADLGLANVDVLLGLAPSKNLADVIKGRCELRDVVLQGPRGISIVPAASGCQSMSHLAPAQYAGIIQAFNDIDEKVDVLIIDTAGGIGSSVINCIRASREVLMIVCDEPTSVTNTYALIKILSQSYGMNRFRILVNMTQTPQEGPKLFARLLRATNLFLDVSLQYLGSVPYDECMRKAVKKQCAVYDAFPRSKCSLAFKALAQKIDSWPSPENPRGQLEFFGERLLTTPMRRVSANVLA
ncbi:MinD/ParA family protein [Pseudomonas sp. JL2]|uniref:MinD/ParA family protein n=1 Tax=Pseudomonas sp. JL2 TaxID=2919942 RepID=UPI002857D745|nr:MinD/ParA family protein [Pseudomonas sp. JL2]MDR8389283.1 MinD/ParA family protein [Pseudomonas sp. JL2]